MKIEFTKSWIKKCLIEDQQLDSSYNAPELSEIVDEALFDLRQIFTHFIQAFNDIKMSQIESQNENLPQESLNTIYIYDLAKDKNGFMIFQKGSKLIFSEKSPGSIQIEMFIKKDNLNTIKVIDTCLQAQINNAASIKWTHDNLDGFVNLEILARYYMKRFLTDIRRFIS